VGRAPSPVHRPKAEPGGSARARGPALPGGEGLTLAERDRCYSGELSEPDDVSKVFARELEYHERLYSGFAQQHFARPAVRALRRHLAAHILRLCGAGPAARVLSIGCGIGDTELLLAPHVGEITGIDLSPAAIRQARADADRAGIRNVRFLEGSLDDAAGSFDLAIAIFFLHHLPDAPLAAVPRRLTALLEPGGCFYSLDPSRRRLSGAIGSLLIPGLMKKYQTPDERELDPQQTAALFAGFDCRYGFYDFLSSPLAGLLPGWRLGYASARVLDDVLIRVPGLRLLGSNFELIARRLR
jgi:SAM-dependent methyltransferase